MPRTAVDVGHGTAVRGPDIVQLRLTVEVTSRLREFGWCSTVVDMLDHFKACGGERWLLRWHAAFDNTLQVSESMAEVTVAMLSRAPGVSCQREETGRCGPELLRKALWSLERPQQSRFRVKGGSWSGEPEGV